MAFPKKMASPKKSGGPGARGVPDSDVKKAFGKGSPVGPAFKKGGMVKKKGKK